MAQAQPVPFGALLKRLRRARGLTQEQLAARAGYSPVYISMLERGARSPLASTVALLAGALDLPPEERAALQAAAGREQPAAAAPYPASLEAAGRSDPAASAPIMEVADSEVERPLPVGGFLGALPDGPLVAREDEMRQLVAVLDAVAAGTGQLVLLAGEPGIGKTRLAQEVSLAARSRGFLVATGRCYAPQQATAYYPFLEALTKAYALAPMTVRAQLPRRWPEVAQLLPDQDVGVDLPLGTRDGGRDDQQRLFWQVTAFLQALSVDHPVALLLDDLHWADHASLDLLQHLARHTRADRLVLLGTYRDVEVGRQHPLQAALGDLRREHLITQVAVKRLPMEGTAALVATTLGQAQVSDEFTDLLHERTAGNPFFTQEVLRALVERGDLYRLDGHWERREVGEIAVPESVRASIAERIARLNEATQEAMQAAGVLGQVFAFEDLRAALGWPEEAVEVALQTAGDAGLVRVTSEQGADAYAFAHALIQQALYEELSLRRRRRLHLAVGEALERLPERERERRAAELAWHFLRAGGPAKAIAYSLLAGDQAEAVYAHAQAERHYATSLDLARQTGDSLTEAAVLERCGHVLRMQSRYDQALADLDRALLLYRATGDHEGELRASAALGWVHADRGTAEEGLALLSEQLAHTDVTTPTPGLASLAVAVARLHFRAGDYQALLSASERAAALAHAVGDAVLEVRAEDRRAMALFALGRLAEGLEVLQREVIPRAEALGDLQTLMSAYSNAGTAYLRMGQIENGRGYYLRSLEITERLANPAEVIFALSNLGTIAFELGNWPEALAYQMRARDLDQRYGSSYATASVLKELGSLYLVMGQCEKGMQVLEDASALAERAGDRQAIEYIQRYLALRDLFAGRPESARDRLATLLARPGYDEGALFLMPLLARAYLNLCEWATAEDLARRSVAQAEKQRNLEGLVEGLPALAATLIEGHQWTEAGNVLDKALALARSIADPYAEAKVVYEYGRLDAATGELARARERFEAALAICDRLGEGLYRPHIEGALAQLVGQVGSIEQVEEPR